MLDRELGFFVHNFLLTLDPVQLYDGVPEWARYRHFSRMCTRKRFEPLLSRGAQRGGSLECSFIVKEGHACERINRLSRNDSTPDVAPHPGKASFGASRKLKPLIPFCDVEGGGGGRGRKCAWLACAHRCASVKHRRLRCKSSPGGSPFT